MKYLQVEYKIFINDRKNAIVENAQLRSNDQIPLRMKELMEYGVYEPSKNKTGTRNHKWYPPQQIKRVEYIIKEAE